MRYKVKIIRIKKPIARYKSGDYEEETGNCEKKVVITSKSQKNFVVVVYLFLLVLLCLFAFFPHYLMLMKCYADAPHKNKSHNALYLQKGNLFSVHRSL